MSTVRGGILGRRKRVLPEPPDPACYVTLWQRDANGRPALVRCRLSEARKSAPGATLADCENGSVKSGRNAGVLRAQKSPSSASNQTDGTGQRSSLSKIASADWVQTKGLGLALCSAR